MESLIELLEESIIGKDYSADDFRVAADVILKAKESREKGSVAYEALSIAFLWACEKAKEYFLKEIMEGKHNGNEDCNEPAAESGRPGKGSVRNEGEKTFVCSAVRNYCRGHCDDDHFPGGCGNAVGHVQKLPERADRAEQKQSGDRAP